MRALIQRNRLARRVAVVTVYPLMVALAVAEAVVEATKAGHAHFALDMAEWSEVVTEAWE